MSFDFQSDAEVVRRIVSLSGFSSSYILLMATAGVLSAVALLTNSVPVLIGSMVVAPAFPPLALVSVGLVYRRMTLVQDGAISAGLGLGISISAALMTAWLLNITHVLPEEAELLNRQLLQERVSPGWYSVVTAIAAGIAGMVALIEQKTDTLVGVVAALALVPAGVAGAIAFLSEDPIRGWGGIALLGINVSLIIASGAVTLLFLGPNTNSEKKAGAASKESAEQR